MYFQFSEDTVRNELNHQAIGEDGHAFTTNGDFQENPNAIYVEDELIQRNGVYWG